MDSKGTLRIRIIEAPAIKGFETEKDYQTFLSQNLNYISPNLKLIQTEFSCKNGRIDILCLDDDALILYLVEIKHGSIGTAIEQIQRYTASIKILKPLLKENIQIRGIIIMFSYSRKTRKEYDLDEIPLESLTDDNQLSQIEIYKNELSALIKNTNQMKIDIETLKKRRQRLNKQIKTLTSNRKNLFEETNDLMKNRIDILMDILYERGDIVRVIARDSNINKINKTLDQNKERYTVVSDEGIFMDENDNLGREACFYFSPQINPTAFAKIQVLGEMHYYQVSKMVD